MNCRVYLSVLCWFLFLDRAFHSLRARKKALWGDQGPGIIVPRVLGVWSKRLDRGNGDYRGLWHIDIYIHMMLPSCLLSSVRGEPPSLYVHFSCHSFHYTLVLNLLLIHSLEAPFTLLSKLESLINISHYHRTIFHRNYEVYRSHCSCSGCCAYPRGCCSPWHG